jgi:protein-tyrosine phosphatase
MPQLIQPTEMRPIPGLAVPHDFYWVLPQPTPLAGMAYPWSRTPWSALADLGLRHVVDLAAQGPVYDPTPLRVAHTVPLEDLYGGLVPAHPGREERQIREAAGIVLGLLRQSAGVVVHCMGGTGRTGTVIGCTLRLLGLPTGEVLAYLNTLHQARGKPGWPESPWQAAVVGRVCP